MDRQDQAFSVHYYFPHSWLKQGLQNLSKLSIQVSRLIPVMHCCQLRASITRHRKCSPMGSLIRRTIDLIGCTSACIGTLYKVEQFALIWLVLSRH